MFFGAVKCRQSKAFQLVPVLCTVFYCREHFVGLMALGRRHFIDLYGQVGTARCDEPIRFQRGGRGCSAPWKTAIKREGDEELEAGDPEL